MLLVAPLYIYKSDHGVQIMEKTYIVNIFDRSYMRNLLKTLGATWSEGNGWFERTFTVNASEEVLAMIDDDIEEYESCRLW
jgi:hypothetical protein